MASDSMPRRAMLFCAKPASVADAVAVLAKDGDAKALAAAAD